SGAKVLNGSYGAPTLEKFLKDEDGNEILDKNGNPIVREHYTELQYQPIYDTLDDLKDTYDAIKSAAAKDMVLVFSAGNEYEDQPTASKRPGGNGMLPLLTPENIESGLFRLVKNAGKKGFDINNEKTYRFHNPSDPAIKDLDFS